LPRGFKAAKTLRDTKQKLHKSHAKVTIFRNKAICIGRKKFE